MSAEAANLYISTCANAAPIASMIEPYLNITAGQTSTPEYLYHYTTISALLSILEGDCLWASDLESTNDPAELLHIWELGQRACLGQVIPKYGFSTEPFKDFIAQVPLPPGPSDEEPWIYEHFISGILERIKKRGDAGWKSAVGRVFAVSFCRKGDLLSQWRGYGLDGGGVCIAFDQALLCSDFGPNVTLEKIEYTPEVQINEFQALLTRSFRDYCKRMDGVTITFSIKGTGPDDIAINAAFESLMSQMADIAHTFKKPGFAEEEEYRLIKRLPLNSHELDEVNVRAKGKSVIPYTILRSQAGKLPIREIIQGPAYESGKADYALVALLKRKGYPEVKISKSKYSLR